MALSIDYEFFKDQIRSENSKYLAPVAVSADEAFLALTLARFHVALLAG